jgi:preprotein translocase subunit SecF
LQISFKQLPSIDEIRSNLDKEGWKNLSLQTQPANNSIIVKVKGKEEVKHDISYRILEALKKHYPGNVNDTPDRVEFIGPVIGKQLVWNTYKAIFGSLLVICIYVAIRFKNWIWGVLLVPWPTMHSGCGTTRPERPIRHIYKRRDRSAVCNLRWGL